LTRKQTDWIITRPVTFVQNCKHEEIKTRLNSSNVAAFASKPFIFPSAVEQYKDKITWNYNYGSSLMGVKLCLSRAEGDRVQDTEPKKEQATGCWTKWWKSGSISAFSRRTSVCTFQYHSINAQLAYSHPIQLPQTLHDLATGTILTRNTTLIPSD